MYASYSTSVPFFKTDFPSSRLSYDADSISIRTKEKKRAASLEMCIFFGALSSDRRLSRKNKCEGIDCGVCVCVLGACKGPTVERERVESIGVHTDRGHDTSKGEFQWRLGGNGRLPARAVTIVLVLGDEVNRDAL